MLLNRQVWVSGDNSSDRPFLAPFNSITKSMTSEMIFHTSSFSSSHPKTKLFPRTQAIDSWYFLHTSLHLFSICRFLVVDPKLGLFFVLSIELHKDDDDHDGVEEQQGDPGLEENESLKVVSMFE